MAVAGISAMVSLLGSCMISARFSFVGDVVNGDVLAPDVVVDKCVLGDVFESLGPCEDRLVYNGDGQLIVIEYLDW